jgi:hypothetical protein
MLTRRHINVHDDELCVMCETGEMETINHLFFDCTFARRCWSKILFHWDLSLGIQDRFIKASQEHGIPFFIEAALIAAWELWKLRNNKMFDRGPPSINLWFSNFLTQCNAHLVRFKTDLRSAFSVWLDAFR